MLTFPKTLLNPRIGFERHRTARTGISLLAIGAALCATASAQAAPAPAAVPQAASTDAGLLKRGEYLTRMGDCIACHTSKSGREYAGGDYMETPLGDIAPPNITPDKDTGIGNWSDDDFYRAMHDGIGKLGEYLYPVFPFPWFTKVTRDDVLAIKAYLFSLPPVHSPPKPLKLAFPANIRESLLGWRTVFFKAAEFKPDPKQSAEINRGAYLVTGLGHCGECHNKENLFGASVWSGPLQGGQIEGWYAPNLTSSGSQGIGDWTDMQLATFLKTGAAPGKGVVLGPMTQTIDDSLHYLTDSDAHAIAAYLKSVKPVADEDQAKPSEFDEHAPPGSETYLTFCSSCHQPNGQGIKGQIPALAGNGAVTAGGPENVIRVVLGGLEAAHGLAPMTAVGASMTDQQIADVTNYVRTSWGNAAPATAAPGSVAALRKTTTTLLAGNLPNGCPAVADPKLAAAIQKSGISAELKGVTFATMLDKIDLVLPQLKAAAPGAKGDDMVRALTATYCPIAFADTSLPESQRTVALGNFSGLVYGRLHAPPKT